MRFRLVPSSSAARRTPLVAAAACAAFVALAPSDAFALQPIGDFYASARARSPTNVEAEYLADQRSGEADQAWGRILPAFTARGLYTRNQYASEIPAGSFGPGSPAVTITPQNQLDAFFTIDVPILDVAGWSRVAAARSLAAAAGERAKATFDEVSRLVSQRYYQVVAAEALIETALRTIKAAEENQRIAVVRKEQGVATELDVQRATGEVELARQRQADAELLRAVSRNALHSLTGLSPAPGAPVLTDNLAEEAPLASWGGAETSPVPFVRAAQLERKAAAQNATAAKAALLPTVAATATERLTNAGGFSGQNASWTAALVATWRLDFGLVGGIRAADAAEGAAGAREQSSRLGAKDRVHDAWQQVRAQIVKSRAARVQAKAAALAASIARDRYQSGVGTQLDLIQAERDAASAEVNRIQADAELLLARTLLRIGAGRPVTALLGQGPTTVTPSGDGTRLDAPVSPPLVPAPGLLPGGAPTTPPGPR